LKCQRKAEFERERRSTKTRKATSYLIEKKGNTTFPFKYKGKGGAIFNCIMWVKSSCKSLVQSETTVKKIETRPEFAA